jgi:hypothetical protein
MANEKVIVSCKLPHGLVIEAREVSYFTGPNGEQIPTYKVLDSARLRGSAEARRMESDGKVMGEVPLVVEGYGLTEVSKDLWEAWLAQNKDSALVKSNLVYASPKIDLAKSQAREQGPQVKSGLEPLDPTRPEKGVEPVPEGALAPA